MASNLSLLRIAAILSMLIIALLLLPTLGAAQDLEDDEVEEYVLDKPLHLYMGDLRPGKEVVIKKIRKGARCTPGPTNICPGVSVNNGAGYLQCCRKHCRNVRGDRNNCRACGRRCAFGKLCCNGLCTNVAYNMKHCGKCNKKCSDGVKCQYGTCGYAS